MGGTHYGTRTARRSRTLLQQELPRYEPLLPYSRVFPVARLSRNSAPGATLPTPEYRIADHGRSAEHSPLPSAILFSFSVLSISCATPARGCRLIARPPCRGVHLEMGLTGEQILAAAPPPLNACLLPFSVPSNPACVDIPLPQRDAAFLCVQITRSGECRQDGGGLCRAISRRCVPAAFQTSIQPLCWNDACSYHDAWNVIAMEVGARTPIALCWTCRLLGTPYVLGACI